MSIASEDDQKEAFDQILSLIALLPGTCSLDHDDVVQVVAMVLGNVVGVAMGFMAEMGEDGELVDAEPDRDYMLAASILANDLIDEIAPIARVRSSKTIAESRARIMGREVDDIFKKAGGGSHDAVS